MIYERASPPTKMWKIPHRNFGFFSVLGVVLEDYEGAIG